MRCVVFTVNCHACVVWPGAPDIVKPASLYTLMFGVSNKVTTSFTYFCVANRAQECSGTSSSTDVAFFNQDTDATRWGLNGVRLKQIVEFRAEFEIVSRRQGGIPNKYSNIYRCLKKNIHMFVCILFSSPVTEPPILFLCLLVLCRC